MDCSAVEMYCGDAIVNGNESCEDGNTTSGDGCSAVCETERVRLAEVRPFAYSISLKNFGSGTVDLGVYRLSAFSGGITQIGSLSGLTISGSLVLSG